jgi:hypothetical protein
MRFGLLMALLPVFACALEQTAPLLDTLDQEIAQTALSYVLEEEAQYIRKDKAPWYWRFDLRGIQNPQIRAKLENQIRSALPQTTLDTLSATRRYSLKISHPRLSGNSALVWTDFTTSWFEPCYWLHGSTAYEYRFQRKSNGWKHAGRSTAIIGDPAPPPPGQDARACAGKPSKRG